MQTQSQYTAALINQLNRDLENNRTYLNLCRTFINEAEGAHDPDTVTFWAHQQDRTLQTIRAINQQLNAIQ
jgi:hypothetical protein